MSREVEKPNLDDMQITRRELLSAPVPIRLEPAADLVSSSDPAAIYIPPTEKRDPLVSWSCRMPLRLRDLLEELANSYNTDMTKIVVDLLEIHLPKIPHRKRA